MKDTYTPFLLSAKGKALVLLGTVALFAAGVYGVTQVSKYVSQQDVLSLSA